MSSTFDLEVGIMYSCSSLKVVTSSTDDNPKLKSCESDDVVDSVVMSNAESAVQVCMCIIGILRRVFGNGRFFPP